jgi:hypothetical protein
MQKRNKKKHIIPFTPYPSLQPSIPTGSAMSMWTQGQYHLIIWLWCTWQSRLTCLVITVAADGYIKSRTLLWWDKCEWILKLWAQPTWLRELSLLGSIFKENLKEEKRKKERKTYLSLLFLTSHIHHWSKKHSFTDSLFAISRLRRFWLKRVKAWESKRT